MADIDMDVDVAVQVPVNLLPLLDDTDGKTIETAVVYNSAGIAITWNFVTCAGVMSQTAITPTTGGVYDWLEPTADRGMYGIEIPASGGASANNDTEGVGWITGVATGVLPFRGPTIRFRRAPLNDLFIDGSTASTNLEDFFDGTGYAGGTIRQKVIAESLDTQAKTDVNAEVDSALNTAIPGSPTADSINERVAAIDGKLPSKAYLTGTANSDGDVQADEATGNFPGTVAKSPATLAAADVSGNVPADLMSILGTALTETAGLIAAGFKKFFNVATPTGTLNSLPDAVPGANNGLPTTNGTKLNQTVDLTAGQFQLKKNVARANFAFPMRDSAGALKTGLTVTAEIRKDAGAAFAALAGSVTEIGTTGWYTVDFAQAETNADTIAFSASAVGANPTCFTILTQA